MEPIMIEDKQPHSASTSETSQLETHTRHCDPKADVLLISNDNVHLRAYSHHLKQVSKFFSDIFTLPSKPEPITLDFPSSTISIYLDLVIAPEYCYSVIINQHKDHFDTLKDLLRLVEFTISEDITKSLWEIIHLNAKHFPQELLILAGERGDSELARKAIEALDKKELDVPLLCGPYDCENICAHHNHPRTCSEELDRFQAFFRGLDSAYSMELLQLMLIRCKMRAYDDEVKETTQVMDLGEEDWIWLTGSFDPSRSIREKLCTLDE
ncbi:hypothetical protein I302_106026 [Kwoniella bestiolae CBS 10118]|uniref:BTB domain-containing protein n=1 Tax=Kwoniella bestiolae CBS 10118 TaxID=1296100 RepID=A0A1B9G2U1_9TREE|nr:hypothetical protein I302_05150 [Kwoniella bestiolae CBS 10118]OCF25334.1 hypothetical protein I302_05150 [Kwoniella bestiolae CBS 10118]